MNNSLAYTGFDKVSKVKQNNDSVCYTYGYDRQSIRMEEYKGNTIHVKDYVGMCEYVTETDPGGTVSKSRTYLTGPYGVFAVVEKRNGVETLHYILKDNLGSWTTVTNSVGTVEQQLSYDAWGNLRNPNTWANYTSDDTYAQPMFDRGYTGHEHLSSFGLINMNGRMYDPVMSSFLSVDRYVQNPMSAQGFNRYAYCMYNPLRFVDPSGWLSGGGGGYGEHPPGMPYYVNGMLTVNLPEVTIRPQDNPSFSNTYVEYVYTPYCCGGGDGMQWSNVNNEQSVGSRGKGNGGGGGNRGMPNNQVKNIKTAYFQPTLYHIYSSMFVYDGQVWPNFTKAISIEAGQHVQIEIINENFIGVQLSLQDISTYHYETNFLGIEQRVYSGDDYSVLILPQKSASFDFYRFDYSPINWVFEFGTSLSEVVNVRINFYSEWKPGMAYDPNHPKQKTP